MANTEDLGISAVHSVIAQMGFFWREQSKHDFGIDAQVELSSEDNKGNGKLLGIQVKSGESYVRFNTKGQLVFNAKLSHYGYWKNYGLPVILTIYSPEQDMIWWIDLTKYIAENPLDATRRTYQIYIPKDHVLSKTNKVDFLKIADERFDLSFDKIEMRKSASESFSWLIAEKFYREGNEHKHLNDFEVAIMLYEKALETQPKHTGALHNRGYIKAQLGQLEAAIMDYNHVLSIDDKHFMALNNRGLAKSKLGKIEEGINDLERAIEIYTDFALAYCNLGFIYNGLERFEDAVEHLNIAIGANQNLGTAFENRSFAYIGLGNFKTALSDAKTAIHLNPLSAIAHNNLGMVLFKMQEFDESITAYSTAIQIDDSLHDIYLSRALVYALTSKSRLAIRDCNKLLQREFIQAGVYNVRGMAYFFDKDYLTARLDFDRAISQEPNWGEPYFWRARCQLFLSKFDEAVIDFTSAIQLLNDDYVMIQAYEQRAFARNQIGDKIGAEQDLRVIGKHVKSKSKNGSNFWDKLFRFKGRRGT